MKIKTLKEIIAPLDDDVEVMVYDDESGELYEPERIAPIEAIHIANRNGADSIMAAFPGDHNIYKVNMRTIVLEIK